MIRYRYLVFIITFFLVFSAWIGLKAGKGQEAINIGTKRQLFFGDMLIESSKGITFTMNPPLPEAIVHIPEPLMGVFP